MADLRNPAPAPTALPFAGRVKIWRSERGFGFIERTDRREVFVHASLLKTAGIAIEVGDRVAFDCTEDPFGRLRVVKIALEPPPV